MSYRIGVDLGTSSVTAAVCDEAGVRVVTLGDRSADSPAAVYLHGEGTLVTGRRAASRSVTNPGRVARGFVRQLGDPESVVLGGQPFTVSELVGVLLQNVAQRVTLAEGGPPDATVLTHPVCWGPAERELLVEVSGEAGLPDPTLVSAPEAIAAHWATTHPGDATVAVYDLGGGTFDAAVLRVSDGRPRLIGTPEGLRLGGNDLDEVLLGHIDASVGGALSRLDSSDPANATAVARVRQDCTRAREALTTVAEAFVPVFLPGRHMDVRVRLPDLQGLIAEPITTTADALVAAVASAGLDADELATVLLVGGSARIPLVTWAVSQRLGRPVMVDETLAHPVAAGAAKLAGQLTDAGSHRAKPRRRTKASGAHTTAAKTDGARAPTAKTGNARATGAKTGGTRTATAKTGGTRTAATKTDTASDAAAATGPATTAPPMRPSPAAPAPPTRSATQPPSPTHHPAQPKPRTHHPTQPKPRTHHPARPKPRPRRRTALLVAAAAASLLVGVLFVLQPSKNTAPAPAGPSLELSAASVAIGDSYVATAAGFAAGEAVELSWTGPTHGVMGTAPADPSGVRRHGPIVEKDPPGTYQIIASGVTSGRTAKARIRVLPPR